MTPKARVALIMLVCMVGTFAGGVLYNIEMTEVPPLSQGIGAFLVVMSALIFGIAVERLEKETKDSKWRYKYEP